MGLDMYLGARNTNGEFQELGYWRKANAVHGWFVRECADGVDECQEIFVSREQLLQLRSDCNNALATRETATPNNAEGRVISQPIGSGQDIMDFIMENMKVEQQKIGSTMVSDDPLAPTAGFFFGSTEKDEWYYNDLMETIDIIDKALALGDGWQVIYQASW
jgi:hypothetical protein